MRAKEWLSQQFKGWSASHFVLDTCLSLLLASLAGVVLRMTWPQIIWIGLLTFGTVISGTWVLLRRGKPCATFDDFLALDRGQQINRQVQAMGYAMEMLRVFAEHVPRDSDGPDYPERFRRWRSRVRAYMKGTLKEEIVQEFDRRAQSGDDPSSVVLYLVGLVNNLTRDDLRSRPA